MFDICIDYETKETIIPLALLNALLFPTRIH